MPDHFSDQKFLNVLGLLMMQLPLLYQTYDAEITVTNTCKFMLDDEFPNETNDLAMHYEGQQLLLCYSYENFVTDLYQTSICSHNGDDSHEISQIMSECLMNAN